jgi:dipeptidyl aminopeptidase/acylaminoacyl peptidase
LRRLTTVFMLALSLSSPLIGRVNGAVRRGAPSIEDFIKLKSFPIEMPVSVSSDGKQVAYTVQDGARIGVVTDPESLDERPGSGRLSRGCEVWIADIQSGKQVRISDPASSSWGPAWSPDGRMVAYFSDSGGRSRAWVWERDTQRAKAIGEVRPQIVQESDLPRWTADSESLVFRAASDRTIAIDRVKARTADNEHASVLVLDSPENSVQQLKSAASQAVTALGTKNMYEGDLVRVSVRTGEAQKLTESKPIYGYWPSPNGSRLVFTTATGYQNGDTDLTLFDIVAKDLVSGKETTIAQNAMLDNSGSAVSWSPDGSKLAYGTMENGKGTNFWIWEVDQGAPHKVGEASTLSYPQFPLWNAQGDTLYACSSTTVFAFHPNGSSSSILRTPAPFSNVVLLGSEHNRTIWSDSGEGDSVYIAERNSDTLAVEIHRLRLASHSDERITTLNGTLALLPRETMNGTADGEVLVLPIESAAAPQDLWLVNRGFAGLRQLTHVNPRLEVYQYPQRRTIHWSDFDGHSLRGTLILPSGYEEGHKYPLIVFIYGGEQESRWANQFSATTGGSIENLQLFATRGYAVFVPDSFMGTQTPMLDLMKSVMPGIQKIIETGVVDSNAMGLMGHSYGGYSVYSLLVQTNRFRAGVALSASGNLLTTYGEMDATGFPTGIAWAETSQGRMGGTPWEVRNKYIENSPFFYLDRIQTPILIGHGDSDWHPSYEGREVFVALRRLGKTAEYAEYRGEGHRISAWRFADQVDLAQRTLAWFDKYLKNQNQTVSPNDDKAQRSTTGK